MELDINKGRLVDLMEEARDAARDAAVAARTGNIIALAGVMRLDVLDAIQRNKVLRHLEVVEQAARSEAA